MALHRSSSLDRSVLVPSSRRRAWLGLAIAVLGPFLVTPVSVVVMDRLPAIPYYVVIALAAWFGRLVAGSVATVISALLLVYFSFPPSDSFALQGHDVASLLSMLGLSTLILCSVSLERASSARASLVQRRLQLLADVTRMLKIDLDHRGALQRLAERVVPDLGDWCAIHLVEDDELVTAAVSHPDPERLALARRLQEDYPPDPERPSAIEEVVRTGMPVYVPEVTDALVRAAAREERHVEAIRELGMRSAIVAPLTARGTTFGTLTLVVAEGEWRYDEQDLAFVLDLAMRTATIVDTMKAYELEHATLERNRIVRGFASALSRPTTLDDVVQVVVHDAVGFLGADRGLIALFDETRSNLRIAGSVGYDEAIRGRWATFPIDGQLPLSEAVREHRVVIVRDRAERDRRYPALAAEPATEHTLVCLPLMAEGEEIGGVSLSYSTVRAFSAPDLALLSTIGSQAAQAVRRALLFEDRDRTAKALQAALLPRQMPNIDGVTLAAGYWPAGGAAEVGGDFYDVIETHDGFVALVGDVCGRGPEAAAIMGVARNTARVLATREPSLTLMLDEVNSALLEEIGADGATFVTMCGVAARRQPMGPGFDVEVVCAGHPHPVMFGRERPSALGTSGLLLGIVAQPKLVATYDVLHPGEGLILYTDGLAERGRDHVPLEEDAELLPMVACIDEGGPAAFIGAVSRLLGGGTSIQDDAAVLVVRIDDAA